LKEGELASGRNIHEIDEGVEEVDFAGLGRLKERDLLWYEHVRFIPLDLVKR